MTHAQVKDALMQLALTARNAGGPELEPIATTLKLIAASMETASSEVMMCAGVRETYNQVMSMETSTRVVDANHKAERCTALGINDLRLLDYLERMEAQLKFHSDLLGQKLADSNQNRAVVDLDSN